MTHQPRQGEPGVRYTYHDQWAGEVNLKADDKGVVHPKNDDEDRAADALGLPAVPGKAPKETD